MQPRAVSFPLRVVAQDVALALFVTVMQVQGTVAKVAIEGAPRPLADFGNLGYALLAVSGLVLAVRRRWPVPVFVTAALASLVYYGLDFPDGPGWLGLFVALYTLAAYGDGRRSLVVAGVGTTVLAVGWLVAAADIEPRAAIGWVFFRIGASVMSAALGESVRSRRVIAAEAQERAELAERTREEEARARVDAERLRIAREVHDTVAHAIAIINVQSGVTAHVLDKRPDVAREALQAIEQTSSRALREMRAILGVLRDDDNGRVPYPGLGQIDELAAKAREAGLDIKLEETAPATALPSAVGSAAYRILQESITNVIRHVGPTRVTIALNPGNDALEIRVIDEGRRAAPGAADPHLPAQHQISTGGSARPGRGILGMRERCQLLGGELDAKPTPGGGFEVRARLPLAPTGSPL
ncbi:two-component sensor histidine kinase [Micromonospora globispora]|uniref:histidine kinase n=1 Tax=Micromonospora globispora TaxID=1450148 RepID=A0A317JTN6_9ACTN|nr:sensor histidine kinase [Micromonospora globispora]PWU44151.1 two-component sensor histidine kinase [Micromonospora globispora]PWU61459.1 two-component sensor histidine kinase [Micromonospora globispora]RQW96138.1 two-component sensor histidine kinase [Micromonospora globispora]